MDAISENNDSLRKPVTSGNREAGEYPYYGASGIVDYVSSYIFDGDYLLVTENRLIELTAYDPKHKDEKSIIQVDRQMMSEKDIMEKRKQLGIEIVADEVRRAKIKTVGELTQKSRSDLLKVRNLGNKGQEEVIQKLKKLGLSLAGE